jgi:imidazoleglycerol phosphate synthase cyclase subunit/phosphoribosyl-ATP pyrophosphohydrolase
VTLATRVIPCLDVAGGRVVKGLRFAELRDAGDPVEAATRYEAEGADEIAFLDISAAEEKRGTLLHLVEEVAEVLSIPFTVGGGVRSVEDAGTLLAAGADRVVVNTAAVAEPALITRIAERYGAQCVVVAVDGKRTLGADGRMRMVTTTHGGKRTTDLEIASWIAEASARGAGEILMTSVDADGTRAGFDVEMLRVARAATPTPIVASGGAGRPEHFVEAVRGGGADAVLGATVFHDRLLSIREVKRAMSAAGIPVRAALAPAALPVAWSAAGLAPVVVRDAGTCEVLMLAWADEEALAKTRETGFAHFFSRERRALWKKGETSGNVQRVLTIALDCDRDALVYDVVPAGPACHTGARSCFRVVEELEGEGGISRAVGVGPATGEPSLSPLFEIVASRRDRPVDGSYTNRLLSEGVVKIAQKVGEEAVETALAAVAQGRDALVGETADLLYHLVVLLVAKGIAPGEIAEALKARQRGPR